MLNADDKHSMLQPYGRVIGYNAPFYDCRNLAEEEKEQLNGTLNEVSVEHDFIQHESVFDT